jgi:hypothetical protein
MLTRWCGCKSFIKSNNRNEIESGSEKVMVRKLITTDIPSKYTDEHNIRQHNTTKHNTTHRNKTKRKHNKTTEHVHNRTEHNKTKHNKTQQNKTQKTQHNIKKNISGNMEIERLRSFEQLFNQIKDSDRIMYLAATITECP